MAGRDETTLDTIKHLKRCEPFIPFHIVMTSGDRYLIENADALAICKPRVSVAGNAEGDWLRWNSRWSGHSVLAQSIGDPQVWRI